MEVLLDVVFAMAVGFVVAAEVFLVVGVLLQCLVQEAAMVLLLDPLLSFPSCQLILPY